MTRVVVVSNPHASRRRFEPLQRALASADNVRWITTESPEDADLQVSSLAADVDLLVLDGGDGTVQRALSTLLRCRETPGPKLAILPGGSTNMTAYDISGARSWRESASHLLRLIDRPPDEWPCAPRPVIRLQRFADEPPIYGMCFGAGAVIRGIEFCQERIFRLGIRGEIASGLALGRALWGILRHEQAFDTPISVAMTIDDEAHMELSANLVVVSALDRLFLGFTPFWGSGDGALHFTALRKGADAFARTLPRLLRGNPSRSMTPEAGYSSGKLNRLRVTMDGPYVIDGEIFPAPEGAALTLDATPRWDFVKLV